jgi:hypothetical protein
VSAIVSRLPSPTSKSHIGRALPPSSWTPTSNDARVRNDGFSKTRATLRPASSPLTGDAPAASCSARSRFIAAARSRMRVIVVPVGVGDGEEVLHHGSFVTAVSALAAR